MNTKKLFLLLFFSLPHLACAQEPVTHTDVQNFSEEMRAFNASCADLEAKITALEKETADLVRDVQTVNARFDFVRKVFPVFLTGCIIVLVVGGMQLVRENRANRRKQNAIKNKVLLCQTRRN